MNQVAKKTPPALICGLGNPSSYSSTRHNVGKRFLDFLSQSFTKAHFGYYSFYEYHILLKPGGHMNLIGIPIREAMRKFDRSSNHLIVVQDDIDQTFGKVKVKKGGSASGHNGVISLIERVKSDEFPRLKIGVGRPERKEDVADYVLSPFTHSTHYSDELEQLEETVFPECKVKLLQLLSEYEIKRTDVQSSEEQFMPLKDLFARLQLHNPESGLSFEQVSVWQSVYGPNIPRIKTGHPSIAFLLWDSAFFIVFLACYFVAANNYSPLGIGLLLGLFGLRVRFGYNALVYMERETPVTRGKCTVVRADSMMMISTEDLVPGDVILLQAGDRVRADIRILNATDFKVIDISTFEEVDKTGNHDPSSPIATEDNYIKNGSLAISGNCRGVVIRIGASAYSQPEDNTENVINTALSLSKFLCALTVLAGAVLLGFYWDVSPAILGLALLAMYEGCVPHSFVGQMCMMANSTYDLLEQQRIRVSENKTLFALGDANCICVEAEAILTDFDYEVTSAVVDLELRQFENPAVEFFNGSSLSYLRILLSGALTVERDWGRTGFEKGLIKAFRQAQNISELLQKYPLIEKTPFQIDKVNHAVARTPDPNVRLLALSGPFSLVAGLCKFVLKSGHATNNDEEFSESLEDMHQTLESQGVMVRSFAYAEVPTRALEGSWKWEDMPLVYAGSLGLEPRILDGVPEAIAECRLNSMHVLLLTSIPLPQATSVALKSNILTGVSSIQATCVTYADLERLPSKAMVKDLLLKPELVLAEADLAGKSSVLSRLRALGNVPITIGFRGKHEGTLSFIYHSSAHVIPGTADVVVYNDSMRSVLVATHSSQHLVDCVRKLFLLGFSSWAPEVAPFVAMVLGLPLAMSLPLLAVQKILKETLTLMAVVNSSPEPVRAKVKLFSGRTQLFTMCVIPLLYILLPFLAYFTVMVQHGFNPQRLPFLYMGTQPGKFDTYNPGLASRGNSHAGQAAYESAYDWVAGDTYDMRLWYYSEDSWMPCYVPHDCYSSSALKTAQTAYFLSLATQTIFTVLTIRSIISSLIRTRCSPLLVQGAILMQAALVLGVVYLPWGNEVLDTRPLTWDVFVVATVPGAALTMAQLELYKWRLRSRS